MSSPSTATPSPRTFENNKRTRPSRRLAEPSDHAAAVDRVPKHDSAVRSFSWMAVAGIARQSRMFLVNWHLMTVLSRECFGTVSLAFGTMVILTGVSDFGLRQVGWREIAKSPQRIDQITAAVLGARLLAALLALAVYGLLALPACHDARSTAIYGMFAMGLVVNLGTFDFPFLARQRMDVVGRLTISGFVLYLVACRLTVRGDLTAWLVPVHFAWVCGLIVASLAHCYRREFGRLSINCQIVSMMTYLRRGWGLMLNGTLIRLGLTYPILVIGCFMSSAHVADYRAPELFYLFGVSFGEYLAASIFGRTARLLEENPSALRDNLGRVIQAILTFCVPIGLIGSYCLPALVGRLFSHPSNEAIGSTAVVLSLLLPVGVLSRFLRAIMPSVGLDYQLLWTNVSSIAMGSLGGWLLMRHWGVTGMAVGLALAEFWSIAWLCRAISRRIGGLRLRRTTRPAVAGILLILIAHAATLPHSAGNPVCLLVALGLFAAANCRPGYRQLAAAVHGFRQRTPANGADQQPG